MIDNRNWRALIRPKALEVEQDSLTSTYGKFVAEPFERGFGLTVGNSLRRILLSSLQGSAITAVHIEGANHEFTMVPDVVEDVTEIILNLKGVLLRVDSQDPQEITISKKGAGIITAGDILVNDKVTILNPEHHIATLCANGKLKMTLACSRGRATWPPCVGRTCPSIGCPSTRSSRRCASATTSSPTPVSGR